MTVDEGAPLYEFNKEEFWDVMRCAVAALGGKITREEFDAAWIEFCEMKRRKHLH